MSDAPEMMAKKPTVLFADDSAPMRALIEQYLIKSGFQNIHKAEDGAQAWEILKATPNIDIVLSDWQMPKMSGLDLLTKVRSDPRFKTLPFLMITSNDDKERIVAAAQGGVSGYIIKPFTAEALAAKISAAIAKHGYKGPDASKKASKDVVKLDAAMKALMPVFEHTTAKDIETLIAKVTSELYPELDRIASGIKGTAAGFGLNKVAEAAGAFVNALREKKPRADLKVLGVQLQKCFYNIEIQYSDGTTAVIEPFRAPPPETSKPAAVAQAAPPSASTPKPSK